jgi:hypothetical protein
VTKHDPSVSKKLVKEFNKVACTHLSDFSIEPGPHAPLEYFEAVGDAEKSLRANLRAIPEDVRAQRLEEMGSALLASLHGYIFLARRATNIKSDDWPPSHVELVAIHCALLDGCVICGEEFDPRNQNDFWEFWKTDTLLRAVWDAWHTGDTLTLGAIKEQLVGHFHRMAPRVYTHHSTVWNLHRTGRNPVVNQKWDKAKNWARETARECYRKGDKRQPGALAQILQPYIAEHLAEFDLDEAPITDTVAAWIKDLAPPDLRSKPGRPRKG